MRRAQGNQSRDFPQTDLLGPLSRSQNSKPCYTTLATFEAGALIKTPSTRKVQENTKYISGVGCRMKHTHMERKVLRIAAEGRAAQES